MSLGHQNSENNDNSAPQNGHDDDRNRPRAARDYWIKCTLLWTKCHSVGAEIVSLRRAEIKETEKGYPRVTGEIRITKSGEVTCSGVIKLTAPEKKAMAAEVAAANFPKSEPAPKGSLPPKLKEDDPREYNDHVFRNAAGEVLFVERRFEPKIEGGKKTCLPWCYRDGRWWPEEPDALPLFGLDRIKNAATICVHEGPKAARFVQEMIDEGGERLEKHPWGEVLKQGAHVGWAGGAYRAHHTDWSTLPRDARIVIICDNDQPGVEAASAISRILAKNGHKGRVSVVRFNDKFPENFDLADPWPTHADWWSKKTGQYIGPTLMGLESPATWATDLIPISDSKVQPVLRSEFAKEWICVVDPPVLINHHQPHFLRIEQPFNTLVRPFSDVPNTASLMRSVFSSQVDGLIYRPGKDLGILTDAGQRKFNIYRPSSIIAKQGDAAPFVGFMEYLFPDKDERHEVFRWCATLIARPEVRMTYGVLLVSETQGVGKSTLGGILAELVGRHNTSFPDEKEITNSDFNSWLARKRLAVVNEIYAGHNHKAYDRLKSLMTDDVVRVNDKHEKAYELENWVHIFACSNSKRALQIHDQDRRWLIPRVVEAARLDAYFTDFNAWLDDGGLPIVAQWAETFVGKPGAVVLKGQHAPMTAAKQEMIDEGRTPGARMAYEFAEMVKRKGDEGERIVFGLEPLREKIADERKLSVNDQKMEGNDLIAQALRQVGLMEPPKEPGKKTPRLRMDDKRGPMRVFANFPIMPGATAAQLRSFYKTPEVLWSM